MQMQADSVFFKVELKNPQAIKGQQASYATAWGKQDIVVTRLEVLHLDVANKDVFVWTEPADMCKDVLVLSPTDDFVRNVMGWMAEPEKFYFGAEWRIHSPIRDALVGLKALVDQGAFQSSGVVCNLTLPQHSSIHTALLELELIGVTICKTASSDVASWVLHDDAMDMMEPVNRMIDPERMLKPRLDGALEDMTVIDLVGVLESKGWKLAIWTPPKKGKSPEPLLPKPVLVVEQLPKKFWTTEPKTDSDELSLGRNYLLALLSLEKISKPEVLHLQPETYYKELLGIQVEKKGKSKRASTAIESDIGTNIAALDDFRPQKKSRAKPVPGTAPMQVGGSSGSGGPGGPQTKAKAKGQPHKKTKSEKTFEWGAALLTHSVKRNGTIICQASCHRFKGHANFINKDSTCRKTFTISAALSEDDAFRLAKQWVVEAGNYRSRLKHRKYTPQIEECLSIEELEELKPALPYISDVEDAPSAKRGRGPCRGRGRGRGAGRHQKSQEASSNNNSSSRSSSSSSSSSKSSSSKSSSSSSSSK